MKYIDLTHTFKAGIPVYPGDLTPEFVQAASISKDGYNYFRIKTGMHAGTHIDAPLHMLEGGKKISDLPLDKFCGRGHLIDARGKSRIGVDLLEREDIKKGDVVLVWTGYDEKFHQKDYFEINPEITKDFVERLVKIGVNILGLDSCSPDRAPFEIHKILFKNGILILENLTNLKSLAGFDLFEVFAFPIKIEAEAALVRVVAVLS